LRLFVAVHPPVAAVDHLRRAIPPGLRLTAVEGWHLTLAFLGEVPQEPPVLTALGAVRSRDPIELRLRGADRFQNAVWVGVGGDVSGLARLRQDVAEALRITDDRPFRPHLTIAYARGAATDGTVRALTDYAGPPWTVSAFALVRSHHQTGGGYERRAEWGLSGGR
jgi:2'-5' RNA ligase